MALHKRVFIHDDGGSEKMVQITKNTPDPSIVVQNTKYYLFVLFDKHGKNIVYQFPNKIYKYMLRVSLTKKNVNKTVNPCCRLKPLPPPLMFILTEQCFRNKNKQSTFMDYNVRVNIQISCRVRPIPRIDSSRCHSS